MNGIPFTKMIDYGSYVRFKSSAGDFDVKVVKISEQGTYVKDSGNDWQLSNTSDRREIVRNYPKKSWEISAARSHFRRMLEVNYYYNN